jgi:hypothetical protein
VAVGRDAGVRSRPTAHLSGGIRRYHLPPRPPRSAATRPAAACPAAACPAAARPVASAAVRPVAPACRRPSPVPSVPLPPVASAVCPAAARPGVARPAAAGRGPAAAAAAAAGPGAACPAAARPGAVGARVCHCRRRVGDRPRSSGSRSAVAHRCLGRAEAAVTASRIFSAGSHRCLKGREAAVSTSHATSAATGIQALPRVEVALSGLPFAVVAVGLPSGGGGAQGPWRRSRCDGLRASVRRGRWVTRGRSTRWAIVCSGRRHDVGGSAPSADRVRLSRLWSLLFFGVGWWGQWSAWFWFGWVAACWAA